MSPKPSLELVIPAHNEEACIGELLRRLRQCRERLADCDVSFIFVCGGSADASLNALVAEAGHDPAIKIVSLSRNFGHQAAIAAGLFHATADHVAILDADLQDPPELIEAMLHKARAGFDVVYGQRTARKGEGLFKRLSAWAFYRLFRLLCDVDIPNDTGDFRLLSRRVVTAFNALPERHRFVRGLVPWIGFAQCAVPYARDERFAGKSKYPIRQMVRFALDAILSFSDAPLRLVSGVGLLLLVGGLLALSAVSYVALFTRAAVPEVLWIVLAVVAVGGVQVSALGIVGAYVARIFDESRQRPLFIVAERINFGGREEHD